MNFTIRKLESHEFSLAKDLFIWFQQDDQVQQILVPSDHYIRTLLCKEDFHVLVAMDGETVIGGLTAFELPMYKEEVNEIFLYEIGVNADYRQKNIATELVEHLKKIAIKRGIPEMYVGTEMANLPAQKLYAKTGGEAGQIAWYIYKLQPR